MHTYSRVSFIQSFKYIRSNVSNWATAVIFKFYTNSFLRTFYSYNGKYWVVISYIDACSKVLSACWRISKSTLYFCSVWMKNVLENSNTRRIPKSEIFFSSMKIMFSFLVTFCHKTEDNVMHIFEIEFWPLFQALLYHMHVGETMSNFVYIMLNSRHCSVIYLYKKRNYARHWNVSGCVCVHQL